jgi:hypothetical protein
MDYRKTYENFRQGLIETILNNADVINSNIPDKLLGYVECGEINESIEMGEGKYAFIIYTIPIFIKRIEDNGIVGCPASSENVYHNEECWYEIDDIETRTLIKLTEKIY